MKIETKKKISAENMEIPKFSIGHVISVSCRNGDDFYLCEFPDILKEAVLVNKRDLSILK